MSLVELRVELPAYAHSFIIHVPRSCNIAMVKQEIFRTCPGGPQAEGQRIIWRGRYLADNELVEELWKSQDEPRIVHLAVHPSAWSSTPPAIPQSVQSSSLASTPPPPVHLDASRHVPTQVNGVTPPSISTATAVHPLAYIVFIHQNALIALMRRNVVHSAPGELEASRSAAIQAVERHGWSWPSILDEPFPAATEGGLRYERTTIDGRAFLSLCNSEPPTPLQVHALKVLTYTFTLLSIPTSTTSSIHATPSQSVPIPPNVNLLLQQLGLPQVRVAQNQNPHQNGIMPELREMPLRPLLAPLMILVFRTCLLLYFVAPARKPIFGILILAWMLYEIWRPIRNGLVRGWRRAAVDNQQRQDAPQMQAPNPAPNAPAAAAAAPHQNRGVAGAQIENHAAAVIDSLGNINIPAEEQILNDVPGTLTMEPGWSHKVFTFFGLLFTTIHPAVWNRRRVALRSREGRIRTEANVRNAPPNDQEDGEQRNDNREQLRDELRAQYERRPRWVRDYMERVVTEDWVDDAD